MSLNFKLPEKIKKYTDGKSYSTENIGRSDSQVLIFDEFVLKIEKSCTYSDNEHYILKTMHGLIPIPSVIAFESCDGYNYLLMSKLCGEMACSERSISDAKNTVKALATGLKMLWDADISGISLPDSDECELLIAKEKIENGEISAFDENIGDERAIFEYLIQNKPNSELVFSHGDYCLPNVFINGSDVCGFLDMGSGGISSKWRDITMCLWSMDYNFRELSGVSEQDMKTLEEIFFAELGIERNEKMIEYYNALSLLF